MPNLTLMTLDELVAHQQEINAKRETLRAKALEVQAAIDAKTAEEDAARILANLSDAQRAALSQQLHPGGIATAEKSGTPGAQ